MIQIRELDYTINKKHILKNLSMELKEGVYGLLGPNGAGKTTLMRCMTGIYSPPKGKIFFEGKDICQSDQLQKNTGYLPQQFGMYKGLKLSEMLEIFAEFKDVPGQELESEVARCLEIAGLEERREDKVKSLSGGMVRRMGIAQAFMGNPKVVILDEPTAGLDPEERLRFKRVIHAQNGKGTILLSTHIVEDVAALCDRIIILNKGEVVAEGTLQEIADFAKERVYLVPAEKEGELTGEYIVSRKRCVSCQTTSNLANWTSQPWRMDTCVR